MREFASPVGVMLVIVALGLRGMLANRASRSMDGEADGRIGSGDAGRQRQCQSGTPKTLVLSLLRFLTRVLSMHDVPVIETQRMGGDFQCLYSIDGGAMVFLSWLSRFK